MSKKKILVLIGLVDESRKNNGETRNFLNLFSYLKENAKDEVFKISINTQKIKSSENEYFLKYPQNKILRIFHWNLVLINKVILLKIFKKREVFLHTRFSKSLVPFYLFLNLLNIRYSNEINSIDTSKNLYKLFVKKVLDKSSFILCSEGYGNYLVDSFSVSQNKIRNASLGFDYKFLPVKDQSLLDEIFSWKKESCLFLFLGNAAEYQGIMYFVNEFKYLVDNENLDLKFLLVGNGEEVPTIKKKIIGDGMSGRFMHIDYVEESELNHICILADIGLSIFSPFRGSHGTISGLKTFTYLLNSLPIITSIMDDKAKMIEKSRYGWVVKNFSKDNIRKIIKSSVSQQKEFKDNISGELEELRQKFSWKQRHELCVREIEKEVYKYD